MGCKGQKEYCRICRNHHAQFAGGFKLPVGAIYGRIGDTYFVSTYRVEIRGKMRMWIMQKGGKWEKKKVYANGEIMQKIRECIAKNGEPVLGKYNAPRIKEKQEKRQKTVEYHGKKYIELPNEMPLPEIKVDDEICDVAPKMRRIAPYDVKHMKPDFVQYAIRDVPCIFKNYADAEKFCIENEISTSKIMQADEPENGAVEVLNEYSFWEIYKDMNRRVAWSDKYQGQV